MRERQEKGEVLTYPDVVMGASDALVEAGQMKSDQIPAFLEDGSP